METELQNLMGEKDGSTRLKSYLQSLSEEILCPEIKVSKAFWGVILDTDTSCETGPRPFKLS